MLSSSQVVQALLLVVGLRLSNGSDKSNITSSTSNYMFPEDFIIGVSTSAYQVEGGWDEGGKGESMWDTYLHKNPHFTLDKLNGDIATDSYHKWKEDVEMIKSMGVAYYRLSISWPRLLPNGSSHYINKDGVRYYRNLLEELVKANITPVVTLYHWDLPTMLMDFGGWTNPIMVDYFVDYAKVAFETFGDIVKIWGTVNEPHQHCYNGYGGDVFVPVLKASGIADYLCTHYMLLAHAKAYRLYDKEFRPHQKGKVSLSLDAFWAEPKSSKPEDLEAAERYLQMHLGIYAHPIFSKDGNYPPLVRKIIDGKSKDLGFTRSRLPYFTPEEVEIVRGSADFFGLNHYTTFIMSPSIFEEGWTIPSSFHDTGVRTEQNPNFPTPGASWLTVYPEGFRKLLNWVSNEYGKHTPIIVTENGMCDYGGVEDFERVSYFNNYMHQMLLAMYEDGCNVQGYFAWTLMDVFEWGDGYQTKFGLFDVDFNSPERTRTPKLSAANFKEIARTRQIDFNYINKTYTSTINNILD